MKAFVSRFGRLQDHPGEKLIPRFAALVGESPKSMLDVLAYAEKMRWIDSAELFIGSRKLRNLRVHEHMADPLLFVQALRAARESADRLFSTVGTLERLRPKPSGRATHSYSSFPAATGHQTPSKP